MDDGMVLFRFSVEETVAELDRLFAQENVRKAADLARLAERAGRLGIGTEAEPDAPPVPRRQAPETGARRAPRDDREPAILLPRRTTHGGPFGASVIARVAANVRKDSDW